MIARRLAALAGTLLVAMAAASPARAAQPGLNVSEYADAQAALDAGAKQVRFFVRWSDFEPGGPSDYSAERGAVHPNTFTNGLSDNVHRVLRAGATPVLVVLGAPGWAALNTHPRDPSDYASFVGELAANLAPLRADRGTIAYEVWNEPDAPEFWGETPDPDFYVTMLEQSYAAIKTADPGATVLNGPTTGNDFAWLAALYARGAKGSFDGVSVHTDTACSIASPDTFYRDADGRLGQYTFLGYREVRKEMLANGDDKPIWLSELGWSTTDGGPTSCARGQQAGKKPSGVDEATQATYLTKAFQCLANDPYVVAGTVFTLRDAAGQPVSREGANYGLVRRSGAAKPGLAAFKRAGDEPAGPCGDFEAPKLFVSSPTEGEQFEDRLDLRALSSDAGVGLARVSYRFDGGQRIGNFGAGALGTQSFGFSPWYGSRALGVGPHTIEVSALDKNGNTAARTVHVVKVASGTIPSTLTVSFRMPKRVDCQGHICTFKGSLRRPPGGSSLSGRVAIEWQFRNKKGQFRRLSGGVASARKPFAFTATLKRSGRWRARVVYTGEAPYKSAVSSYRLFRLK